MAFEINKLLDEIDYSTVQEVYKLDFIGVDGLDVYNITSPFIDEGKLIIAGRVEKRDSENSNIMFFEKIDNTSYKLLVDYPVFNLQDPYFTFIDNQLILGGTKVEISENGEVLTYCALKLKGNNVKTLVPFFEGPDKMKDIRLLELNKNKILCLTRPQGEYGGRGKIGYCIFETLEDLSISKIESAPLLDIFIDDEWGGANQIFKLSDDTVGVLGHIAKFDEEGNRHYYPISFSLNIIDFTYSNLKILLTRSMLDEGSYKREDLIDVIFSGGLIDIDKEICEIYMGVSDAEGHFAKIKNPFIKY